MLLLHYSTNHGKGREQGRSSAGGMQIKWIKESRCMHCVSKFYCLIMLQFLQEQREYGQNGVMVWTKLETSNLR